MKILWYILQFAIGYNLFIPFILFVISKFYAKKNNDNQNNKFFTPDYAIIVTAYQEISHIPITVQSILNLKYKNYLVYVVLDNCPDISCLKFNDDRVILLKPDVTLGGNVKSHFFAINNFKREHNILTIIDSDNIVDENYLNELNHFFEKGYQAVQGIRNAKNLNSEIACLDAARDIYYHFYDGYILFNLGSSATLSGSGMAFSTQLYKNSLKNLNIEGAGFDKVLQYQIVKADITIAFAEKAIVYDQKTSNSGQLVNQRARWINTWFKYFKFGFYLLLKGINKLSLNQFLFGLILLRPPLFIFLSLSLLIAILNLFIYPVLSLIWMLGILIFALGFWIALSEFKADNKIIKSFKYIPVFICYQFISLIHSKNANKRSVVTKHFHDA